MANSVCDSGETEWSRTGHYTGITELDLTENGRKQVEGTGKAIVGSGRLIDPARLARVFISPRKRAQDTFDILLGHCARSSLEAAHKLKTTETLAEWGYGQYEGLLTQEIRELRQKHGLDQQKPWDIWTDGCEDGECVGIV
jgi:sedoheptulose-bisphosphatase